MLNYTIVPEQAAFSESYPVSNHNTFVSVMTFAFGLFPIELDCTHLPMLKVIKYMAPNPKDYKPPINILETDPTETIYLHAVIYRDDVEDLT